jgi:tRNA A-37 threonylcarbamoyl transferase component Bud32
MPFEVGQEFAGYTILRVLGTGGMGRVYLASHPRLPRDDALKVLPPDLTGDPEFRARFSREADLVAGLSHPHIVGIHDRGEHDGQFWISMDYVAGIDAARVLRERFPRGMPADEALPIIDAVGAALDYAHHRGLLHRDVKPANVLLAEADPPERGQGPRAFLADFGIARRIDDSSRLTATNMAVGTAAYAAPEQLMGEPMDGRADQYALACTAFHLLTGAPPFDYRNLAVVITHHVSSAPPSIGACRPELAGLDSVFAKAMAKNPADRFASCQEFAQQLIRQLDAPLPTQTAIGGVPRLGKSPGRLPGRRRRRRVVRAALVAITALVVAGGVFAGFTQHHDPATAPGATGPLTGTYRADFGPLTDLDDAAGPSAPNTAPALSSTYGLRSECGSAGCVATASRLSGVPVGQSAMTFDQIGGSWVAVALASDQCRGAPAEFWQVFTLRPRPDGTFAGEYNAISTNACVEQRTVTFTRTGDVDVNKLPDPVGQPPRVASPAEALRGHYQATRTFANGLPQQSAYSSFTTRCLRTGDRCLSFFHGQPLDAQLVFVGGSWTLDIAADTKCPSSEDPTRVTTTGQFPMPRAAPNPITLLTGHGHVDQAGPCVVSTDFDETFTRISD